MADIRNGRRRRAVLRGKPGQSRDDFTLWPFRGHPLADLALTFAKLQNTSQRLGLGGRCSNQNPGSVASAGQTHQREHAATKIKNEPGPFLIERVVCSAWRMLPSSLKHARRLYQHPNPCATFFFLEAAWLAAISEASNDNFSLMESNQCSIQIARPA